MMRFSTAVVYVDDGRVPEVLSFYERAFGLTRRFYDPAYQYGEPRTGEATTAHAAEAAGLLRLPAVLMMSRRSPLAR